MPAALQLKKKTQPNQRALTWRPDRARALNQTVPPRRSSRRCVLRGCAPGRIRLVPKKCRRGSSFTVVTLAPAREMIDLDDLVVTPDGVARAGAGASVGVARVYVVAVSVTRARPGVLSVQVWELVDPKAELGYHFSPYAVNGANPISYNDPDGDWIHLAIGAVVGGVSGYIAGKNAGATGGKLWGYVAIGAGAGALSAGVGSGINAAIAGTSAAGGGFGAGFLGTATLTSTGFAAGAASGAGAGLVNGFATGAGYSLMGDNSIGNAFASGLQGGVTQAFGGAVLGGLTGGIDALIKGKTFWTGSEGPQVFKSPVSSNYGNQNGECVLRCLEEFSESYGDVGYDYNYWLKQNGGLGVASKDVVPLVNGSGRYTANAIPVNPFTGDVSSISSAFQSGKRVMMGLSTSSGGNHAVMVNKLKVWPSGRYRMFFSETSPTWLVPRSTSNIRAVGGSGFWQFFR